jgi:hypothetical protein
MYGFRGTDEVNGFSHNKMFLHMQYRANIPA